MFWKIIFLVLFISDGALGLEDMPGSGAARDKAILEHEALSASLGCTPCRGCKWGDWDELVKYDTLVYLEPPISELTFCHSAYGPTLNWMFNNAVSKQDLNKLDQNDILEWAEVLDEVQTEVDVLVKYYDIFQSTYTGCLDSYDKHYLARLKQYSKEKDQYDSEHPFITQDKKRPFFKDYYTWASIKARIAMAMGAIEATVKNHNDISAEVACKSIPRVYNAEQLEGILKTKLATLATVNAQIQKLMKGDL